MSPKTPDRVGGCFLMAFGTFFTLIGLLFLTFITLSNFGVVGGRKGDPGWGWLLFPLPFLGIGIGVFWGGRHLWSRPRPKTRPEESLDPAAQREALRTVVPFVLGFILIAVLSFWASNRAEEAGAPWFVRQLAFFGPGVLFILVAYPFLHRFQERMARAIKSPEGRAAATVEPPPNSATEPAEPWPTAPAVEPQPGRVLAHALERLDTPAARTFAVAVAIALFWNGIVGVFVWQKFWGVFANGKGGPPTLALVPFVLVGVGLIAFALYSAFRWAVAVLVGRVAVEVSGHPLVAGGRYRLHVAHRGLVPLVGVVVEFVCQEVATYTAGTSSSTDTRIAFCQRVPTPDPDGTRLPFDAEFAVPSNAMHSFDAANNEIRWVVRVGGRVLGGLPFSADFLTAVSPGVP